MEIRNTNREMTDFGEEQSAFEPVGELLVRQVYAKQSGRRFLDCITALRSNRPEG